jgi:hypothetical protein
MQFVLIFVVLMTGTGCAAEANEPELAAVDMTAYAGAPSGAAGSGSSVDAVDLSNANAGSQTTTRPVTPSPVADPTPPAPVIAADSGAPIAAEPPPSAPVAGSGDETPAADAGAPVDPTPPASTPVVDPSTSPVAAPANVRCAAVDHGEPFALSCDSYFVTGAEPIYRIFWTHKNELDQSVGYHCDSGFWSTVACTAGDACQIFDNLGNTFAGTCQ